MIQEMTWPSVLEKVNNDTSINFLARVTTVWSAISLDALFLMMESKGIMINGVIGIDEHKIAGYLIDPSFFTNKCCTYYNIPYSETKEVNENAYISAKNKGKAEFYKTVFQTGKNRAPLYYGLWNSNIPPAIVSQDLTFLNRQIIVCHYEEGIGIYSGFFAHVYQDLNEVDSLGALKGYLRNIFIGKHLYSMFHKSYNSLTLCQSANGWIPCKEVIPYYRQVFRRKNEIANPQIDREELSKSIIICTIAWRRDEIQTEEDIRVLREVCGTLNGRGYRLFLKPHPRDTFTPRYADELGVKILDVKGLSLECLCEYAQPKAIVSFHSSTLVNPTVFWNIPTICLANMMEKEKLSENYKTEISKFKKTFGGIVHFVSSADEILSVSKL